MVNIELNEKRYEEIKSKKNSENPMIFANPSAPMNAQSSSSCSLEFSPCPKVSSVSQVSLFCPNCVLFIDHML